MNAQSCSLNPRRSTRPKPPDEPPPEQPRPGQVEFISAAEACRWSWQRRMIMSRSSLRETPPGGGGTLGPENPIRA
jgi:hypothetical protein